MSEFQFHGMVGGERNKIARSFEEERNKITRSFGGERNKIARSFGGERNKFTRSFRRKGIERYRL